MRLFLLLFLFANSLLAVAQTNIIELEVDENNKIVVEDVPFDIVERVPIFKGCNKNLKNEALKKCFSEKLNALISENFNSDIGKDLDLPDQSFQYINVMFKVNPEGKIIDVAARTIYPELEAEAVRVIKLIPKLEPGYFKDKAVTVPYFLPITFKVDNPKLDDDETFPVYKGCNDTLDYNALKECTTNKIKDYLKVSINYEMVDKLFPLDKSTQFMVRFTVNKSGKAEKITAKAHKKGMAVEAINILKRMPKFKKPGYKNGKPIDTEMEFLMTIYF
jgi:hypothetical protein